MDTVVIIDLVNSVGFPVLAAMALFWLNRETVKRYEKLLYEFKTTIEGNTAAINSIRCNHEL